MKQYVSSITVFLFFVFEAAASGGPGSFNYEGRVYDISGAPSTQVVSFIVQIYNPAGTCLLRSE